MQPQKIKIYNGSDMGENLKACGIPCAFSYHINACAAVTYIFKIISFCDYDEKKAKKAVARLAMLMAEPLTYKPALGGFSVELPKPEAVRDYPHFSAFYPALSRLNGAAAIPLGLDEKNESHIISLDSAPHVLVTGASGSGKTVFLHDCIAALVCASEAVQFVLIDLKRVELSHWSGLEPLNRLAAPIITDERAAYHYLAACVDEMERRYKRLAALGAQDNSAGIFPKLVIIIDELADLMLANRNAAELPLVRLAQKGRAAGIHLVLATQRPTVNVITGLLKANIPCRVCFSVASIRDSIVAIDKKGAENLRGRGDAIAVLPNGERLHVQAPLITQTDIHAIAPPPKNEETHKKGAKRLKKNFFVNLFAEIRKRRKKRQGSRDIMFLFDLDNMLDD